MPSIDSYSLDQYRLSGGGIAVKSVQRGTASINGGIAQIDVKIGEVDLNKVALKFDFSSTAAYASENFTRGEFIDSTTIRFARGTASSGTNVAINYEVIEFEDVKSIQRGTYQQTGTANINITISPVNISKSIVFASYSFEESTALINSTGGNIRARLESSTSLVVSTINYVGPRTVKYQVVEFE